MATTNAINTRHRLVRYYIMIVVLSIFFLFVRERFGTILFRTDTGARIAFFPFIFFFFYQGNYFARPFVMILFRNNKL